MTACGKSETDSEEPTEQDVNIYLVAPEGSDIAGKSFGCNDLLVPLGVKVLVEKTPLEAAINYLISYKPEGEIKNYVKGPNLILYQVTAAGGIADVYLKGEFEIAGVCDIPRIEEQLNETARQFAEYKKVNFYINNKTLQMYLSIEKESF